MFAEKKGNPITYPKNKNKKKLEISSRRSSPSSSNQP
jgi:hypothetical protein